MTKPNCYDCKFRQKIPGDAHSECKHPEAFSGTLDIAADAHGVQNGWFLFPLNFDPVWLRRCNGFVAKTSEEKKRDAH